LDYQGYFLTPDDPNIRGMLIGNRVPHNFRKALEHYGFEWKEIPVSELLTFLENKNDTELLRQFNSELSTPIESKKDSKSIEAKNNNKFIFRGLNSVQFE
jgi:hypothetical protein